MYPESMAISETLVASEAGGDAIKYMGIGFGISGIINVLTESFLNLINNTITFVGSKFYKWKFSTEVNPLLLGIGFIVGLEVSLMMFAGSVLANFGITPLIGYFTDFAEHGAQSWNDTSVLLHQMDVNTIAGSYVKYIGAGMMLCGGIIGAIKLIPTIVVSLKETFKAKSSKDESNEKNSGGILMLFGGIIVAFVAAFIISQNIKMAIIGAIVSMILSLLFVIVAGRLTGTIGTSNLPVSGMTIASLVILTLVFVIMGWTSPADNKSLLLFAAFMVVAIAVAGGYSQSQKVSYIIGGSRSEMRNSFAISSVIGVIVVTGTILVLSSQLRITGAEAPFALPQANLMSTLTSGIMSGDLPWPMIIVGIVMALFLFLLDLPIMTIAIGFYLPISTTSIILVGALIRAEAPFALPQANLMSTLTSGIMSGDLPWPMIIVGIVMALFLFLLDLPIMTIAIGFYLPISTTSIILVGALIRVFVEKMSKDEQEKEVKVSNGISLSSGLVAGGSIIGLIVIILQVTGVIAPKTPTGFAASNGMGIILLIALVVATTIPIMMSKIKLKNE